MEREYIQTDGKREKEAILHKLIVLDRVSQITNASSLTAVTNLADCKHSLPTCTLQCSLELPQYPSTACQYS